MQLLEMHGLMTTRAVHSASAVRAGSVLQRFDLCLWGLHVAAAQLVAIQEGIGRLPYWAVHPVASVSTVLLYRLLCSPVIWGV